MANYPYTAISNDPKASSLKSSWTCTINADDLGNAVMPNIDDFSKLTNVTISWEWQTSVTGTSGELSVYINGTKVGGTYKNQTSWQSLTINNLQGYFNSETANVGKPTGNIEFRFSATVARVFRIRNLVFSFDYTPKYYLDVNGWINGAEAGELRSGGATVGTMNVYIDGSLAKSNVDDYYVRHLQGTKYEIKDINAMPGWHYDDVHSGSTSGTLTQETKIILAFSKIRCTVSASAATGGMVEGSGTFDYGTSVTLTAKADMGYDFAYWSDNQSNTDPTRTFTVTSDVSLTAVFVKKKYEVTVLSTGGGEVQGIGTYEHGAVVTLTAVPYDGYKFVSWGDGNTDPTRTFTVTSDVSYSVIFEVNKINKVYAGGTNTNVYIDADEAEAVYADGTKIYG